MLIFSFNQYFKGHSPYLFLLQPRFHSYFKCTSRMSYMNIIAFLDLFLLVDHGFHN